ncbi:MAG: hypothetical protein R3C12_01495 [Planctomycetaceae bacterium]
MTTPYPLPPLPPRDASGHKGSFGSVLLVGARGACRERLCWRD